MGAQGRGGAEGRPLSMLISKDTHSSVKETLLKHNLLSGRIQQGMQDWFFFSAKRAGCHL